MSDTVAELVDSIRAVLAAAGDPAIAVGQQRYMKSAMPYHGVTSPVMKAVLRPVYAHAERVIADRGTWLAVVRTLWDEATHREQRYAAIGIAKLRCAAPWRDAASLDLFRWMVMTGAWWDYVDDIAAHLVGPVVAASGQAATMRAWAVDEHMWVRRTAILHQLRAKAATDTDRLADTIVPNLAGSRFANEFFIRKAIGWALREYAYHDPEWVRAFVRDHAAAMAPLTRREALKHLAP